MFLSLSVANLYLQWRYSHNVFSSNPCELCRDLNDQAALCVTPTKDYNLTVIRRPKYFSLNPFEELTFKIRWLSLPCDLCSDFNNETTACFWKVFAPEKNKNNNLDIGVNFSQLDNIKITP